jgi:hypothetical protein
MSDHISRGYCNYCGENADLYKRCDTETGLATMFICEDCVNRMEREDALYDQDIENAIPTIINGTERFHQNREFWAIIDYNYEGGDLHESGD